MCIGRVGCAAWMRWWCSFFFQAEDGIRYRNVTGVQTCALPIFYLDGAGEIGVISSVTQAFCSSCTRMRLSTEGSLFTCLFGQSGHDLKSLLRGGASDEQLRNEIAAVWQRRGDRYSEIRTEATAKA